MRVIGIDPGKSGAAAEIADGKLMSVYPFKKDLDRCRNVRFMRGMFFIEKVTSSPQMGVVSSFTFGRYAEAVETSARNSCFPVQMVRPQVWQNAIGCVSGGDKQKLYEFAQKLFPVEWKKKVFNKESADAVLIAYYGYLSMTVND